VASKERARFMKALVGRTQLTGGHAGVRPRASQTGHACVRPRTQLTGGYAGVRPRSQLTAGHAGVRPRSPLTGRATRKRS
jgi:hypothetical protein